MNKNKMGMFVILSLVVGTVISGTAVLGMTTPAFANGHDHDEKKCKKNGNNNCNDEHKTQKIDLKNECEIENYNKDHSKNNFNDNFLKCINDAQNLNGVEQIFGPLEQEP
ncbi:MAG TPA: hypothetical protein VH415_07575 [Nitrososphaeraceae archaeon]|jgi:hypothetical protein